MSTTIGEVNINLRMSLAQFKQDTQDGTRAASQATKEMSAEMSGSFTEARGSIMLLNEELGLKMPRHLESLMAQIPGLSAAFAAMLPIVGVIAATKVVLELVEAHNKAKEAMATAMDEIGANGATVLGNLNEKLNSSKLKFLELANDGAGVAALRLDMLSHTTLTNLIGAFDNLGKSVSDVLNKMGAEGTIARIMGITASSDLIKNLQNDVLNLYASNDSDATKAEEISKKIEWYKDKAKADVDALSKLPVQAPIPAFLYDATGGSGATTEKAITAAKVTYAALEEMSKAHSINEQTAAIDTSNIEIEAANKAAAESDKIWMAQNTEEQRNLKATEAAQDEAYKHAVSGIQESEKLKIDATRQGTQARLDAVIAAIKDEEAHGLQDTAYYKSLQEQKVTIAQDIATKRMEIERKLAQEMSKAEQGMIALNMAAMKEQADYEYNMGITTQSQRIQAMRAEAQQELELEKRKNADVLAEMDANDPLYPVALQKRLDADLQAQQKYDNEMVKLDHDSMQQRKQAWDAGFNSMNSGMTTLVGDMMTGNNSITKDLKSMLQNMLTAWIDYFIQLKLKALETALFMKVIGVASGGASGAAGGTGGAETPVGGDTSAVPFFAEGGHMDAGDTGIVGDAGPELWKPDSSGEVIPFDKLSTGSKPTVNNFTMHVHGVSDADSFRKSGSQIQADMIAAMGAAHRRNR